MGNPPEKLAVSWNPTVCSQVDLGISASFGIGHGQRSPLPTGNPRWPPSSHRPAAPERRRSWNTWWTQRMAPGHQWWDGLNATERYWAVYLKIHFLPITSYTFYIVWGLLGIICCLQVFDGLYLRLWRSY
jgi:hypothetical protein